VAEIERIPYIRSRISPKDKWQLLKNKTKDERRKTEEYLQPFRMACVSRAQPLVCHFETVSTIFVS
jgi:hypothetical protein